MPRAEEVCQVNTNFCSNKELSIGTFKGCTTIPIPVFEMSKIFKLILKIKIICFFYFITIKLILVNLFTYKPDFITTYCRLSIFIEHFIMVKQIFFLIILLKLLFFKILQCEQRCCMIKNDSKIYGEQLNKLIDFQQKLDNIWRSSHWISNIASVARYQKNNCAILLTKIMISPNTALFNDDLTDVGYHSDQVFVIFFILKY